MPLFSFSAHIAPFTAFPHHTASADSLRARAVCVQGRELHRERRAGSLRGSAGAGDDDDFLMTFRWCHISFAHMVKLRSTL